MNNSTLRCVSIFKYAAALIILLTSRDAFSQQAWTEVPTPDTSTTRNMLRDISGTSSTDVWTVGSFEATPAGNMRNLIMHWNGNAWQIIPNTDLSISLNDVWGVSAIAPNDVWAAGMQNNYANTRSQLLHWNGTTWTHTFLPNITGGSYLFSIDAITTNDIWAVGGQAGSPTRPAYTVHYNGSTWTEITAPNAGIFRNAFNYVDGIASNDAWAVGHYGNNYGDFRPMAQHWNGSTWTNIALPATVVSQLGELYTVTMIASNDVWAVGSTLTGYLLIIHWNGTSWTEMPTLNCPGGKIVARGPDLFAIGSWISQWNGSGWTVNDSLNQYYNTSLGAAVSFSNGDIWTAGTNYVTGFTNLVYRTANATPQFLHGSTQALNTPLNSLPKNIDELLKVLDADISQVVTYTLLTAPSHGTISGLPDTAITNAGIAISAGVSYTPVPGYSGADQFLVKVSVGPLTSQSTINVNVFLPLPILINAYSITRVGATAILRWTTTSEINTKEFLMQRSADGIRFTTVSRINAYGSGHSYSLVDPSPLPGLNYYRLQLVDMDGRLTDFAIKVLNFDNSELRPFAVYPNPVIGKVANVWLNATGDYVLSLYDPLGLQVMTRNVTGTVLPLRINLPESLKPGVYILTLIKDKLLWSEKIYIR